MALSNGRIDIPLVVGLEVAYFNPHQMMGTDSVKRSTISRILKTVVVLEDGERFRRPGLDQHRGGSYGWNVYLYHRDDPKVVEQQRKVTEANRKQRALNAAHGFIKGSVEPKDVILAMAPFLSAEQQSAIKATLQ